MAKKYKIYHNGDWVSCKYLKDSESMGRAWIEYDHVEDDEEGVPKEAVKRTLHVEISELQITE
jgi:hypothetical protein